MAISDTQKIDDLYKKLVFGVTKTDIAGNKSPSNEAIPSPLLVRGDTLWNGSGLIPSTPPGASEGVVAVHTGTSKVAATSDPTVVPATRTWITGSNNWIPPQFGSGYTVKVYADTLGASNPQVTGTLLPPDGINNDAYIFDYQAGVLNFADTNLPAALTGKYIFIVGYTYTGTLGVSNNSSIGDLTIIGSTIGTSVTNGNVTIDANGTGAVVLNDQTTVNGALTVIGAVTSTTSVSAPALNGNVTATGLSTFANVDINSGTIDATVIGATTRAAGSFTTVTGGTATFASINNTPIGNAVPSTGAFTTLDANGNVNLTGTAQSTLTTNGAVVIAGGVGIAKNLNVGGNAIVAGDLTVQGTMTTVNSTTVDIADVNLTLASNATNPAQADGAGLTINGAAATMLYSGTNDDWTFNKNVNIPNVGVTGNVSVTGQVSAGTASVTGLATVGILSTANAQVTGGAITNTPISGAAGSFTSMTTANIVVTGGTESGVTITNSPISGSTGNFTVMTTGNAQVTGGAITATPVSGSTVGATVLTTANAQVTGGNISSTPIGVGGASSGAFTSLTASSFSAASINNTPVGNATPSTGAFTTLSANDQVNFTSTAQSNSSADGAVVLLGGLGVAKNINLGGNLGVTGDAVVGGNLTVQGILTSVNSTTVEISDVNLTLAKDATNAAQANGAGLTVAGANATMNYSSTNDDWTFNKNVNIPNVGLTGNITVGGAASVTGLVSAGSASVTGAATVGSLTTSSAQITGGNISGVAITTSTGSFSTLTTTNFSTGNAQVTGGSATGLLNLGSTNGTVTNLTSSNVAITGGTESGVTITNSPISGNTGNFTVLTTGNAQITGGVISGTTIDITSIAASNVEITGGYIDGTTIGGNVAAAGSFTTINASGVTHITDQTQSTVITDGALIVDGGVGIAKNLNVGQNVVITGNLQVNGVTTTVNSTTVDVADINITIAKGAATASAANGAGITVDGPAAATILYTSATNTWNLNLPTVASEFRGNVVGTNLTGTLQTAAQPNVTSLGTLSSLTVTAETNTGSLVTSNAQITGGSIAGTTSMNITDGTVTNLTSSNVAITGGSITTTAGSFTTLAASTSLNATTSGAITLESGTLGTMNNVTIGETTRAAAYFTDVTGGLATFAALNGTIIGNTSAAAGTFTSINGNDVTVSTVYTVGIEANGTSTLNTVSANTVTVNTELVSNTAATFNGTVTTNGAATFNDTITANNQVTLSPATGTVTINPINQGSIDNVTVNAVTLISEQVALLGGYIDGTIIGANVPAAGYFSTLSGGSFSASSINDTPIGNASPSTGDFTTLSSTLGITGDLVTSWQPNITLLGTLQSLVVTGEANLGILLTGNAQITGGNIYSTPIGAGGASSGLFTSVGATTGFTGSILTAVQTGITTVGTLGNLAVSGNAQVNGTATVGTLSTTNAQITGGAITSTPISGSTGQFSVLTSANVALTGGNISGTAIGYGPAGAAAGTFTTFSADNGTITNFASGNVNVTGGAISGVGITSSNGSFNTLSGIDTSATNFTTSNAHINGGAITSTPISGSTGSFTTLTTSSTAKFEGVLTANNGAESYSTITGALQVVGGAGVTGNVNVGNGLRVNANKSAQPAVFKGVTDNTLLYVRPSTNQIMFGGNVSDANIATAFVPNATVIFNSTDSVLLPSGTTGQRPGVGSEVKGMTRFNTTFNYMEYWNGAVWASTDTVFTLITDQQFVGNGLTTNFTLSTPSTTNATIVSINGVVQIPGLAYSVATSTLQFDEAPLSTDVIDVRVLVTTQTISGMASSNGFNQIIPDDTDISVWTGTSSSTQRWKWDAATGNLLPVGPNMDIGSPTAVVDNIYVSNVIVSGGSISGVSFTLSSIDNTPIGQSVAAAGTFAQLSTNTGLALTAGAPLTADQTGVAVVTNTVIDSFAKATYRSAKYVVSITSGSNIQTAEVLVIHDGTNTAITTYGVLALVGGVAGAPFVTFTAGVNGSNIELKATGTGTAKVQRTYVAV